MEYGIRGVWDSHSDSDSESDSDSDLEWGLEWFEWRSGVREAAALAILDQSWLRLHINGA